MNKSNNRYKVSAIVSVYNSEQYLHGCFEDLLNQTLYKNGLLQIVVVNTGSTDSSDEIIKSYEQNHPNIRYLNIPERESIYRAWNRGVEASEGEYLSNANTDDRHKEDFYELTSQYLDNNHDADLIYVNSFRTNQANDTFYSDTPKGLMKWSKFDKDLILFGCFMGPHPVWRKSVHADCGLFDSHIKIVGDYEMWLKMSRDKALEHYDVNLGLYYYTDSSAEHIDSSATGDENSRVQKYYITRYVNSYEEVSRLKQKQEIIYNQIHSEEYFRGAMELLNFREKELDLELKMKHKIDSLGYKDVLDYFITADFENFYFAPAFLVNVLAYVIDKFDISDRSIINYIEDIKFQKENKKQILSEMAKYFERLSGRKTKEENNMNALNSDQLVDKAIEHLENHEYEESKQILESILQTEPENLNALNNLSVVEAFMQNYRQSAAHIQKVLNIDPSNKFAIHNIKYLDELLDKEMGADKLNIAEKLIEANELEKAEEVLQSILKADPKNVDALNDLAVVETINGNYRLGIEYIKTVLEIDNKNSVAIDNLNSIEQMVNEELDQIREQLREIKDE